MANEHEKLSNNRFQKLSNGSKTFDSNEKLSNKIYTRTCGKLTFYYGIEQGTQEWLDLRKGKVTCSNAYKLLTSGINACLDENKRSAERLTPNGNKYAERGHVVEAESKDAFNKYIEPLGLKIMDCTFVTNSDYPNAGYSPDGLCCELNDDDPCEFIPLECKAYNDYVERNGKTVFVGKHLKAVESLDNVPLSARIQCQMEMMIMEADHVILVLSNPDCEDKSKAVKLWTIDRDEEIISRLKKKLAGC